MPYSQFEILEWHVKPTKMILSFGDIDSKLTFQVYTKIF